MSITASPRLSLAAGQPQADPFRAVPPRHVAFILDGNRRWSKAAGVALDEGYRRGAEAVVETVGWCSDFGIEHVTLWALATENLRREPTEVDGLLRAVTSGVLALASNGHWRIRPIGVLGVLPSEVAQTLRQTAEETARAPGMHVNIAIGYDGREEIATAVRQLVSEWASSGAPVETLLKSGLTTRRISDHLFTRGQPDPDLVVRTSGERRLSGFLPWQTVASELYFSDVMWPDFKRSDLVEALHWFSTRQRRFGT